MLPLSFWIKRFCLVFLGAFVIIAGVQLLKGHPPAGAAAEGALWAAIATSIFIVTRYRKAKQNIACALCKDTTGLDVPQPDGGGNDGTAH